MSIAYTPHLPTTPTPGIAEPPPDMPERLLWKLWQRRAERQAEFRTGAGRRVRVLYPGRAASAAGPDFRDALLEVEGLGLVRGDVEIHKRESDWDAHGHGGDPNYNGVALHAALETDTPQTPLASGSSAPVISLSGLVDNADDADDDQESAPSSENLWRLLARRGYPQPSNATETGALLSQAGDERFRRRAAALERFAREQGPEQTLYEALLEGLGYRHNQQPFVKLASRAPISALRQAARPVLAPQRPMVLRHWLLAISGLADAAPSGQPQFPPNLGPTMARNEWRLFRVRPANHPAARIAGVAELTARFLDRGLLPALADAAASSPTQLTAALTVAAPDGKAAPIGPGRARDLAVNAALPLLHALDRSGPQSPYIELYRRFPKLPDNEILREMTQRLLPQPCQAEVNTARRQQGLLHLAALLRGAS